MHVKQFESICDCSDCANLIKTQTSTSYTARFFGIRIVVGSFSGDTASPCPWNVSVSMDSAKPFRW
jgi:hypothetical protein